jgi:predicted aspartyl protease
VSDSFNPQKGLIVLTVEVVGPVAAAMLRLALDTGATGTLINAAPLVALGYKPALATEQVQVTTGSGVEFAPRFEVSKLVALGVEQVNFPVICHTLPPSAAVDGLLGLDSLRGRILTIDFVGGQISLRP